MLKPYMVSEGMPEEAAILVFAHTAREAKRVGFPCIRSWNADVEWVDIQASKLVGDYLFKDANQAKLAADIPHCNDTPTSCKECGNWGMPLNIDGYCEGCAEVDQYFGKLSINRE